MPRPGRHAPAPPAHRTAATERPRDTVAGMWMLWSVLAFAPEESGCAGLDMDGDGVCDREVADWSADASLTPGDHRGNIYQLSDDDLLAAREAGLGHVLTWPVTTTRLLLPYRPMQDVFTDPDDDDPGWSCPPGMAPGPDDGCVPLHEVMETGPAFAAALVRDMAAVGMDAVEDIAMSFDNVCLTEDVEATIEATLESLETGLE